MKILVTGVKGQLGYDIVKECKRNHIEAVGVDIDTMDITNKAQVEQVIQKEQVDAVIHCAAYTAVDKAEDDLATCHQVNVEGTRNIAEVCNKRHIKMMYFSSDYVFAGDGITPWQVDDACFPTSIYGKTKLAGEQAVRSIISNHFIIRISWVFGINGNNFIKTMLRLGKEKGSVSVVDDQIGSPTYTYDLAKLCVSMIQTNKFGTYHATNEGECSWYTFACEIFKQAGVDVQVQPVDSTAFPAKAKRPKNSRLDKSVLDSQGFTRLPDWQDALQRYLQELQSNNK